MPTIYTFLRGPDGSHGKRRRSGTRRPIDLSWADKDVWDMDVARQILEHCARQHTTPTRQRAEIDARIAELENE